MFITLSIIFVFIPSIIIANAIDDVVMEKPIIESSTRAGRKFLGLFSVNTSPVKLFINNSKRWRGDLFLTFGPHKLIATSVEFNHAHVRDPLCVFCQQHPQLFNPMVNHNNINNGGFVPAEPILNDPLNSDSSNSSDIQIDSKPTSVSVSASASVSTKTEAPTMTKKSSQDEMLRTLKLEDYDMIAVDPNERDISLNRVRRESENIKKEEESNDETESTTFESSTLNTMMSSEMKEDLSNNHVVSISPMLELPQNPPQEFSTQTTSTTPAYDEHQLYPPSKNSQAQFISITNRPVKNYYDFYPSQPDVLYHQNYYNLIPHCVSDYFRNKFVPIPVSHYNKQQQSYYWK